ncbi:MAG: RecX family transcriptional regulator [Chloroflexi bacterium]|nr:RecX family transcriptional regulator [Chloroflexota bacterium]
MIISSIEKRRGRRVDVYVDGRLALTLAGDFATERGLRPGATITPDQLSELADEGARRGALEAGLRLLSYRLRSEEELRRRLTGKKFKRNAIDSALARLRELGYLDDEAFARYWAETRQAQRPRSRRLLASELRSRGIDKETAEQATADVSDVDAAYLAASGKLRALRGQQYQAFRERLGRFLTSRGFGYDIARQVIERCWAECEAEEDEAS